MAPYPTQEDGLRDRAAEEETTTTIEVVRAIRNARAKLIEPNFNRVSNFDRTLPEWCGHKPGARPERFEAGGRVRRPCDQDRRHLQTAHPSCARARWR